MALGVSDFLHYWEYTDHGLLTPAVGGQPVFSRAGVAWARMREAQEISLGLNTPRFEPDGLRLELSVSSTIASGSVLDFSGWSIGVGATVASAVSIYDGQTASKVTATTGTTDNIYKIATGTMTSGTPEKIVYIVEEGNATTCFLGAYNNTDAGWVYLTQWSWSTLSFMDSTWTYTSSHASYARKLFDIGPNGGRVYELTVTYTPNVSGKVRAIKFVPDNTSGTKYTYAHAIMPAVQGAIATSVYDGTSPTETFYWDRVPAPQAMVFYHRWVTLMKNDGGITACLPLAIDSNGTTPRLVQYLGSTGNINIYFHNGTASAQGGPSLAPTPGDLIESFIVLNGDGSTRISARKNSGASAGTSLTAPSGGLPSAWASDAITLNSRKDGVYKIAALHQALKIVKPTNLTSAIDGTDDDNLLDELRDTRLLIKKDGTLAVSNRI